MPKSIKFDLDDSQIADLQRAFPELSAEACARDISRFAAAEMIDLLAGRKRYLSLSHQYIEWLEQLNATLLPDVEFTPRRLMNQFSFPPGTASYIARVLRDRQNVTLMKRAWTSLLAAFKGVKDDRDALKPNDRGGPERLWSITLSRREYRQLEMLLDEWEAEQLTKPVSKRNSINLPEISENRLDYIKIKYSMPQIEVIIDLLAKRV